MELKSIRKTKVPIPPKEDSDYYVFMGKYFKHTNPLIKDGYLDIVLPSSCMSDIVVGFDIRTIAKRDDGTPYILIDNWQTIKSVVVLDTLPFCREVSINDDINHIFCTDEYLISKGFVENYVNGVYYHNSQLQNVKHNPKIVKFCYDSFKENLGTYIRRHDLNTGMLIHVIDALNKKLEPKKLPLTYRSTNGMQYTFGIEIECQKSNVSTRILKELQVSRERDGSLNNGDGGPEYITSVLQGDIGINHLQTIMKELALRSTVDKWCSIHVHLGNIKFTKEVLCNLYLVATSIESELFNMMPQSRRSNVYCRRLPLIKPSFKSADYKYDSDVYYTELYTVLFKTACGHEPNEDVNSKRQHPQGPKCGYNKENIRYCWINFIHALFTTRGQEKNKTIEFRLHSATLSFEKVYMWLLICMAIVKYSENVFVKEEQKVTLKDVILYAFPEKYENILQYINTRTALFQDNVGAEKLEYYKLSNKKIIKKTLKELCA